jgi:hypothetical protein
VSRWFRYYDDALNDPKVQSLRGDLFKAWVNLLCVASKNGGVIPSVADAAFGLRMTELKAAAVVTELAAARLLDRVAGGTFAPHNWNKRQFKSDTSNERVKAFRQREKKQGDDVTVHGAGNVTGNVTATADATAPEQNRAEAEQNHGGAGAPRRDAEMAFQRFWQAYPKRQGANPKEPARKAFRAAVTSGVDAETVIAAARRYAAELQRDNKLGTQFVARAVTWLNEKRWGDYPPPPGAAVAGFYARDGSAELAAWDAFRGRAYPRDRNGGWHVPAQWPPGHPQTRAKEEPDAA